MKGRGIEQNKPMEWVQNTQKREDLPNRPNISLYPYSGQQSLREKFMFMGHAYPPAPPMPFPLIYPQLPHIVPPPPHPFPLSNQPMINPSNHSPFSAFGPPQHNMPHPPPLFMNYHPQDYGTFELGREKRQKQPQSIQFYNSPSYFSIKPPNQHSWQHQDRWVVEKKIPKHSNFIDLEEEKQCPICFEHYPLVSSFALSNCQHSFHPDCLKKIILSNIQNRSFPCRCPDEQCNQSISQSDIQKLLSYSEYLNYEKFSRKYQLESHSYLFFCCPTPNCEGYSQLKRLISSRFNCEICKKQYCTVCSKPWHYGPCLLSKEDEDFIKLAKKKLFKTCPKCRKIVEKISGCHHIVCSCRFEFFYICEKEYRHECKCKSMSFGEHRTLMAQQRREQQEITKRENKQKKLEKKAMKEKEKEQKKKKREEEKQFNQKNEGEKRRKNEENIERKMKEKQRAQRRILIEGDQVEERKTRKLVKRHYIEQ